jgi:hypothetical protein
MARKTTPSPKAAAPKRKMRIYTGPNSRELGLYTHMRFRGEYPEHVASALAENPGLESFFEDFSIWARRRPPGSMPPRSKPLFTKTSKLPPVVGKTFSPFRVK